MMGVGDTAILIALGQGRGGGVCEGHWRSERRLTANAQSLAHTVTRTTSLGCHSADHCHQPYGR